jgi:uncharacterized protein YwqG
MSDPRFARIHDDLERLKRNSIQLEITPVDERAIPLGGSKFGGRPDAPKGMEWPRISAPEERVTVLPFVAQIRLSDLAPHDVEDLLPDVGLLFFFQLPMLSGGDINPACWKVIFHPSETDQLERLEFPEALIEQDRSASCTVTSFRAEWTLPHVETCFIGDQGSHQGQLVLTEEEWSSYSELRYELRSNQYIHQMLGHSDDVQPYAMEGVGYTTVRDQLFPEWSPVTDEFWGSPAFQTEVKQGRLLLQLREFVGSMFLGGREGHLFFFVKNNDLAARNFDRVWVTEQ